MKKFIKIIGISLVCILSFAFNAKAQWSITFKKGDEMLNTPGGYQCIYSDILSGDGGGYSKSNDIFIILSNNGIFNCVKISGINIINVIIGYYKDGKLIEKEDDIAAVNDSKDGACLTLESSKKIIDYLRTEGDVRIYAEKYSRGNYDVTFPMNTTLK